MQQRLTKDQRHQQLLDVAAAMIREAGTDSLTLITLAQQAGVSKPVTYKHFGSRAALLLALYQDFDQQLVARMEARICQQADSFDRAVGIFASAYLQCLADNGAVYEAVVAALQAYPEHQPVRSRMRDYFIRLIERTLCRFLPADDAQVSDIRLVAVYGAAREIAALQAEGVVSRGAAEAELGAVIRALLLPATA